LLFLGERAFKECPFVIGKIKHGCDDLFGRSHSTDRPYVGHFFVNFFRIVRPGDASIFDRDIEMDKYTMITKVF